MNVNNINADFFGFELKSKEYIREVSGTLHSFEHKKSGARLCYLDREDENKTFAIAFKTPPSDNTGVFHIIEHSVLSGSRKFPVKEPFVELLKGSLNTFLNALTYEDKTVYPVSSRNEKDFFNLTDVYLDAVFHPLMLEDKAIFYNEGWRYERDDEGNLTYNGVVYNEMKGAYSSPDESAVSALNKALFSGSIYEYDSGGNPEHIPELSYEGFVSTHEKYYHPSNSYIFLDGKMDIDKMLSLIDSYLCEYERKEMAIPNAFSPAKDAGDIRVEFEPGGEHDSGRMISARVFGECKEHALLIATAALLNAVAGSNDSPLKKALIEEGLCEDVSVFTNTTLMQTVMLEYHGINPKLCEKIKARSNEIIASLANGELCKDTIKANLDRLKFRYREKDYGSLPKGVAFALAVYGVWLYGIEPSTALKYEDALEYLYSLLDTDYYHRLLCDIFINCPHRATALLVPDESYLERKEEVLKSRLSEIDKKMRPDERKHMQEISELVQVRNCKQDSPEALDTIPALTIDDIAVKKSKKFTEISHRDGVKILKHNLETEGIMYTELYFSVHDLDKEELSLLQILSSLLSNSDTENYSESELKNKIKSSLGSFSILPTVLTDTSDITAATPYMTVHTSALCENGDILVHLIEEVLTKTKFTNSENLKKILLQMRSVTEDSLLLGGEGVAMERVESSLTSHGICGEYISGIFAYEKLKAYIADFDETGESLLLAISSLAKRIFIKERLCISCVGSTGVAGKIADTFLSGSVGERQRYQPRAVSAEGICLPIDITHTAFGFFSERIPSLMGSLRVAKNILSYEYLWPEIRVKGGSYGAGFVTRRHGVALFYSYRDPNPERSIEVFYGAADFLEKFAEEKHDLTKYIIGAVGEYDILLTPRAAASLATANYLSGRDWRADDTLYRDIIKTDSIALTEIAKLLKSSIENSSFTVVANKEALEKVTKVKNNIVSI